MGPAIAIAAFVDGANDETKAPIMNIHKSNIERNFITSPKETAIFATTWEITLNKIQNFF